MMETDTLLRLIAFLIVFVALAAIEIIAPRRQLLTSKKRRWFTNLSIIALNPLTVALVYPVLPFSMAMLASDENWGLLNHITLPYGIKVLAGVMVLDLVVYVQHVLHHAVPILWRLHMVHHADLDVDITTGLRFHPIEIVVSVAIKLAAIVTLGVPPLAMLIFQVTLNTTSMFSHSNIRIPVEVDRILRLLVVTPDMHRVHHSVIIRETNSNYGFCLPWWDRLFGTYKDQPAKGHTDMVIGLAQIRDQQKLSLPQILILPFSGDPGKVPINRH